MGREGKSINSWRKSNVEAERLKRKEKEKWEKKAKEKWGRVITRTVFNGEKKVAGDESSREWKKNVSTEENVWNPAAIWNKKFHHWRATWESHIFISNRFLIK